MASLILRQIAAIRDRRRRKKARPFKRKLWARITAISNIRSANSPPPLDAAAHITYLHSFLDRYESLLQTEEGSRLDLKAGGEYDLPYLRFALDRLRIYHQTSGVEEIGNENARIYIYFVQSRLMEMADVAAHRLEEEA